MGKFWVNERGKGKVDKIDEKKNGKRALKEATFGNKRLEIKLNTNTRDYGVSLNIYGCIINLIIWNVPFYIQLFYTLVVGQYA